MAHAPRVLSAPIERDHDRDTRRRLQKSVQPFMLGRTQVRFGGQFIGRRVEDADMSSKLSAAELLQWMRESSCMVTNL